MLRLGFGLMFLLFGWLSLAHILGLYRIASLLRLDQRRPQKPAKKGGINPPPLIALL
jgi:hypothetical protein